MSRGPGGSGRRVVVATVVGALVMWLAGCAPRLVALPAGPGTPVPDPAPELARARAACRGVRTLTAEMSLAGRAAGRTLRGRVHAGFAEPDRLRLEGVAPFGPPVFILAGTSASSTLLLPRESRALDRTPAADIVEALAGVRLAPAELAALVTGCGTPLETVGAAERFEQEWVAFSLGPDVVVYTRAGVVVAARLDRLRVDYEQFVSGFPRRMRLTRPARGGEPGQVDLVLTLAQLETNVPIVDEAFAVIVPPDAAPLSLDEVRGVMPGAQSER